MVRLDEFIITIYCMTHNQVYGERHGYVNRKWESGKIMGHSSKFVLHTLKFCANSLIGMMMQQYIIWSTK